MNKPILRLTMMFWLAWLCALPCAAQTNQQLPNIGSSASRSLSLAEEQAIGDDYMRQLRAFAPLIKDAEITDYIQHLGFKLVAQNPAAQDRKFSFFVINQDQINAFALPGGYIGIFSGLITRTDTESELASVLGHEIAHVTQRHLARRLELQNQLTVPRLAAFAAAIIIASQSSSTDAAMGAFAGSQGLAEQALINHTRANEAEADRIGIQTLYQAGFDTRGMVSFFEKIQQDSRYHSDAFEFLRTHPLSRNRITDARLRVRSYPSRKVASSQRYFLMKEKLRAITERLSPDRQRAMQNRYKAGQMNTDAELYGYAIYLTRIKQFDLAEQILDGLRMRNPDEPSFAIAQAKLNIEKKEPKRSIPTIKEFLATSPGNLALVEIYAELLLADNQGKQARQFLLENIHMTDYAPHLYKLLSAAQSMAGYKAEVYETEGNYLLTMGDLKGAKAQFQLALNFHTDDPYARARITASLNRIDEYLRERSLRH